MEFVLSFISLVDFILDYIFNWTDFYFKGSINDQSFIWLRLAFILRDFRILLIIQEFKGLLRLFRVLSFSGPFLIKILILFITVLSVYAYAGNELFGKIDKGVMIDDYLNFTDFPKAMLTLFKCSTKNAWRFIMIDCTPLNPYC